jgi:predicted  nucleic acid-binding Zn-ribbon protein
LLQEYQSKIDRLQAELQAVRDKEGAVFLPQEMYEEQTKKLENQEEEIRNITKELKSLETQRDELTVRNICYNQS